MSSFTYVIPADNKQGLLDALAKINKRAAKLNMPPIEVGIAFSHTQTWTQTLPSGRQVERAREWLNVTVTGATPQIAGYTFRATIHHTSDGNLLAAIPGFEVPRQYRNAPPVCDHCRKDRRRSTTYLLEGQDGIIKQVGHSCLEDFTGVHNPQTIAKWAELIGAFDVTVRDLENDFRGRRVDPQMPLESFLTFVSAVMRKDGWVSMKVAREDEKVATAFTAWLLGMGDHTEEGTKRLEARYLDEHKKPFLHDVETATAVVTWAEETLLQEGADLNDYLYNLSVITRSGIVSFRTMGLAASMIVTWKKETQRQKERAMAPSSPSRHVGAEGDRLRKIPATVLRVVDLEPSQWGPRSLVSFEDEGGNIFVWFTGAVDVRAGDTILLTGTVKRHGEFAGVQQTELSRCSVVPR